MNFLLTGTDILRFGIILYVVAWVGSVCYLNVYSNKKFPNVHKVARWYAITVAIRLSGWIIGLAVALMLIWILPEITVVTRDPSRKGAEIEKVLKKGWGVTDTTYTPEETFYVDRYYVLFSYGGRRCDAFNSYLLNESDSTLVMYTTCFFNGQFTGVSDVDKFEIIPPGYFQIFDRGIKNRFDSPNESSFSYIPKDRKNKITTELTITIMSDAVYETERIREKIRSRNEMIYGWYDKDSSGISLKARETVFKQSRK